MRRQITALAAAGVLAASLSVAASWPAHAQSGNQFYADGDYLNGWGGGPDVDAYTAPSVNNDFIIGTSSTPGDVTLVFSSGGGDSGQCVGDAGNSEYSARASLPFTDCSTGNEPWGGNMQEQSCGKGIVAFYDVHWKAYVAFSGSAKGSAVYLNGTETCYTVEPADG
jgi:hypothetical protein